MNRRNLINLNYDILSANICFYYKYDKFYYVYMSFLLFKAAFEKNNQSMRVFDIFL